MGILPVSLIDLLVVGWARSPPLVFCPVASDRQANIAASIAWSIFQHSVNSDRQPELPSESLGK
ncbi:MAG: hypothetical protein ACM37W_06355 [Actinomycetota bacterium]